MKRSSRTFLTLDGLRGVAALAIAIRHAPFLWRDAQPTEFLNDSYLAVDFFFLLSGFVIAHAYGDRLRNDMPVTDFAVARLRRLYPMFALAIALSTVSVIIGIRFGTVDYKGFASNLAFSLFMLPAPIESPYLYPLDAPAWSLFFELCANAVFATVVARWSKPALTAFVGACALGLVFAASANALGFDAVEGPLNAGASWNAFGAGLLRVGFGFFAGVLLYRLFAAGWRLPSVSGPSLCLGLFVVLVAWIPTPLRLPYDLIAALVLFPAIVLAGASAPAQGQWAERFEVFGGMSYPLYVLQSPLYKLIVWAALATFGFDLAHVPMLVGFLAVGLAAGVGIGADRCLDRPIARLFANWSSPSRRAGLAEPLPSQATSVGERGGNARSRRAA